MIQQNFLLWYYLSMINIVLYCPEKPSNVGNIMRTVSATDSYLIIIGPLSFEFNDKSLKRAGMDYLENLNYKYYESLELFLKEYDENKIYYVTRYSKNIYSNFNYSDLLEDITFMFGRESTGIPHELLKKHLNHTIRIPMVANARSLNLSNTVALVLYEALRQRNFFNLATREEIKGEDFLITEDIKND